MAVKPNTPKGRSGTARKAPSAGSGPKAEATADALGGVQPAAPNVIPAADAAAAAGAPPPAADFPPSDQTAPVAEDGTNPPSAGQPSAQGEAQDTQGAPTGDGGEEASGSETSKLDAPATAAAAGEDHVLPEPALPTQEAGGSGKAAEVAAAVTSEPTHEFEVLSPVEFGPRFEPGQKIPLTRTHHAELKLAGAISGDWPAD